MNTIAKDLSKSRLNTVFLGVAFFWSVVIVALAAWNYWQSYTTTVEVARSSANQSYSKDLVYRHWGTVHGGVYAPVTPETPPNPYLSDIPERDIRTPAGKKLTLINPAYMTRQVHELGKKDLGMIGHITSLKPIRPENVPDEWEKSALQAFESGKKEVSALEPIGNETYLRFMRPLTTGAGCLKCHAQQGYRVGDIRGGISVSLPWAPFRAALRSQLLVIILGYGVIWTMGICGLYLGRKRLQDHLAERKQADEALRESEMSSRTLIENSFDVIFTLDAAGIFLFLSPAWERHFGYPVSEVMGKNFASFVHPDDVGPCVDYLIAVLATGQSGTSPEYRVKHADGSWRWFIANGSPYIDPQGQRQFMGTGRDITEWKRTEEALEEERRQLQQAFDEIRTLRGIVPICSYCKKIRDDKGYWNQVEQYVSKHTEAKFSHGICPACFEEEMKKVKGIT